MIISIYVTYNPNIPLLEKAIDSLIEQVDYAIVVDNSPEPSLGFRNERVIIEALGDNIGIAAAQNIGIRKAIELGAEYIVLSDQDTVYPESYVRSMLPVFKEFQDACVVVPKFVDAMKNGEDGFIAVTPVFFQQFFPSSGCHEILQAIASGKIIKVSSLEEIGLMDEGLFIDWVDFEWCWRARAKGYKIMGNADVLIQHQLGDDSKDLGFREINLRSPIRHYYITRNAFYLSLYSNDLDIGHRINLFFKSFLYIVGYPCFSKPHLKHLKAVLVGFRHGITKQLGKYELK